MLPSDKPSPWLPKARVDARFGGLLLVTVFASVGAALTWLSY